MIFTTDLHITSNNVMDINLPDMTRKNMVPWKLTINQMNGPKDDKTESPARDIICRVFSSVEIVNLSEAFFRVENVIDLSPYFGFIERYGRLRVNINNRHKEPRSFRIITEYKSSMGGLLYQERANTFENIMDNISKLGYCTKLTLCFNKPLQELSFLTTSTCQQGNWIDSFGTDTSTDEDQVYLFDFTSDDLKEYADDLQYLKLNALATTEDNTPLLAYVMAWGFPNVRL